MLELIWSGTLENFLSGISRKHRNEERFIWRWDETTVHRHTYVKFAQEEHRETDKLILWEKRTAEKRHKDRHILRPDKETTEKEGHILSLTKKDNKKQNKQINQQTGKQRYAKSGKRKNRTIRQADIF